MTDKDLIISLGGPAVLSVRLGFDKSKGGVQRVNNWMTRGIPSKVKVDYPHLFLLKGDVNSDESIASSQPTPDAM